MQVSVSVVGRSELVTDACGISRLCGYEESAVGTELCGIALHFCITHVQMKVFIEQANHIGRISRTAAESGLCGNAFAEMGVDAWKGEIAGNEVVCFDYQILAFVSANGNARYLQVARHIRRKSVIHFLNAEYIGQRNGVEYRFYIMVSVGSPFYNVES